MTRPGRNGIDVRQVTHENEGDFVALWTAFRVEGGATPESVSRAAADGRVGAALARVDVSVYLARVHGEAVGYIVLTDSPLSGLSDAPCVWIDQLYVAPRARRAGAARVLLGVAARHAERIGADQVASCVPAHGREANRFYARLGFSSHVVRRVTSTTSLRRRLAGEDPPAGLDEVLHRRRSLRARASRSTREIIGG